HAAGPDPLTPAILQAPFHAAEDAGFQIATSAAGSYQDQVRIGCEALVDTIGKSAVPGGGNGRLGAVPGPASRIVQRPDRRRRAGRVVERKNAIGRLREVRVWVEPGIQ